MGDSVAAKKAKAALETKDVLEMLSGFFREAAVLVLVFLPLEQSKGGDLAIGKLVSIAALCIGMLVMGIAFEKWR
jgi:hypothetical protein